MKIFKYLDNQNKCGKISTVFLWYILLKPGLVFFIENELELFLLNKIFV